MYIVKTTGTTRYKIHKFKGSIKWAWCNGLYFVSYGDEQEFIKYIEKLEDYLRLSAMVASSFASSSVTLSLPRLKTSMLSCRYTLISSAS